MIIKWGTGEIDLNMEVFLHTTTIAKFKKMIKLIRKSKVPEAEETIRYYISDWLSGAPEYITGLNDRCIKSAYEIESEEMHLFKLKNRRKLIFDPGNVGYKELTTQIKESEKRLKYCKAEYRQMLSNLKKCVSNKQKFKKFLSFLEK